jgi:uncharacterized protein (DUF302 family)
MSRYFMKYIAGFVLLATTASAGAANGLVTLPSKYSVAETIDRFEAAAKAEKFKIFSRVDFQPLAAANGGNVRPNQLLIFGRGGVLPPLLPKAPVVAIDLPFKALAWEDADGKVWLTYNTAEYLKERHAFSGSDELLKRVTGIIQSLAKRAVG